MAKQKPQHRFANPKVAESCNMLYSYLAQRSRWLTAERTRLEYVDREIERTNDTDTEQANLIRLNSAGDKTRMRAPTIPVIKPQYRAALGYMDSVFLEGYPIYAVVARKDAEDTAAAMHALIGRDQNFFEWSRNIRKAHAAGLRYNVCGVEVRWETQEYAAIGTENVSGTATTGKATTKQHSGNSIRSLDMYNTFYDRSVPAGDVSKRGDFAGYIEQKTYGQLKDYLRTLPNEDKNTAVLREVLNPSNIAAKSMNTAADCLQFFRPKLRSELEGRNLQDFRGFFPTEAADKSRNFMATDFNHVTAYVRIIPQDFGFVGSRVTIYRIEWVNGVCIYAAPSAEGHNRFATVFCAPMEDDEFPEEHKSLCEDLIEFQDIATSLARARMKGLRRLHEDRALFDPTRIRESDINSKNPSAKIPVRMNALNKDLSGAYYQIPYRDEFGGVYNSELAQAMQMSREASGINPAMNGQFVKGNKTFSEFDRVMSGGDAKLQLVASSYEAQMHVGIKYIIRSNYLQFAVSEELQDKNGGMVTVDPAKLREEEINFTMVDGALPASKVMNPELVQMAITGLSQVALQQQQAVQYDLTGMIASVLKSAGFANLEDYKLPQQPMQTAQPEQPAPSNGDTAAQPQIQATR